MKKILFIHDNSPESSLALTFAISIAANAGAHMLLAFAFTTQRAGKRIIAGNNRNHQEDVTLSKLNDELNIPVNELDISAMNGQQLVQLVNSEEIWMVIKSASNTDGRLNLNTLISQMRCPLLLVPENLSIKSLSRIVYLADLRYCRREILYYLADLARSYHADLSIAHLTKEGLTHMDERFAAKVFDDEVRRLINYDHLFFNYTQERNLPTAADVLINGLHNDMLVISNNRYHFNELIGPALTGNLPSIITVPLLIFPS